MFLCNSNCFCRVTFSTGSASFLPDRGLHRGRPLRYAPGERLHGVQLLVESAHLPLSIHEVNLQNPMAPLTLFIQERIGRSLSG
jgi:hypothetical protein